MSNIKQNKKSAGLYLSIISFLTILIAFVVYLMNATGNYYNDLSSNILVFSIASLVLIAGIPLARILISNRLLEDVLLFASVIAIAVSVCITVSMRVQSIAYIMFSDLESGNLVAKAALQQYFFALAFYLIGLITTIASGFTKAVKT